MRFGKLYPIYARMVMPGDSFSIKPSHFIRFASVISPILNKISITYSAFYVPFRLVWKYFPTFISGGYNNDGVYTDAQGNYLDQNDQPTSNPFIPKLPTINALEKISDSFAFNPFDGSLLDWLGYPTFRNVETLNALLATASDAFKNSFEFNALPLMCYYKVVRDWFTNNNIKDESLLDAYIPANVSGHLPYNTGINGIRAISELAFVNYGLDYFTSSLPYLQRGDAIMLNGSNNEVTYEPNKGFGDILYDGITHNVNQEKGALNAFDDGFGVGPNALSIDNSEHLSVQLGTTIQELRFANALQQWAEKSLRVGTRYIDFLKAYFGVKSSDRSLQRSEYLGSTVHDVTKLDIDQMSGTDFANADSTPQGTTTSKLLASDTSKKFDVFCEEHGMVFVMCYITPETIYKNRMRTEYLYRDKEDFLFPEFAHLSPQAVQNQELFVPRSADEMSGYSPDGVFGYQDRYNELRQDTSDVHGDFKGNLSFFLQMREFTKMPVLNTSFLKADDVNTSIFATNSVKDSAGNVLEVDQIWASFDLDVKAVRCLPKIAIPQLV